MIEPDCFFDMYQAITNEAIEIFEDSNEQRKMARAQEIDVLRDALTVNPQYLRETKEAPPSFFYMQRQLKQTRPYILTREVIRMALDMVEKAGDTPIPYKPFLKLPFWIEFDGVVLGAADMDFGAIWAIRESNQSNSAYVQFLCPDMQQSKSLFIDLASGQWKYTQMGACENDECELAQRTKEGELYQISGTGAKEWMRKGCTCSEAGYRWFQLVNVLNHILRHCKEPLVEQITERELSVPYQKPKTRKEKVANSETRRKSRPNIITISLSAPVKVSQRTRSGGKSGQADITMEKMSVEGYWKVLIPGEGKPWKSLQILQVTSYERRQRPAEVRDRYRVDR